MPACTDTSLRSWCCLTVVMCMGAYPEVGEQCIVEVHAHGMDRQVQVLIHRVLLRRHPCRRKNAQYHCHSVRLGLERVNRQMVHSSAALLLPTLLESGAST